MPKILITGCAGFIGSHTSELFLSKGYEVFGIDNFDPYYSRKMKEDNLKTLLSHDRFTFIPGDINDEHVLNALPADMDAVVHLAARVGVRPSINDPHGYITANITGTQSILDWMRRSGIKKMVFASSSSVYGNNLTLPFSETDNVDHQISPYAAAKRAAELFNHVYHHLYDINIINLRFFTVFGPRQRPDLAIRKFVELIKADKPITLYGDGSTSRDYTYVADIVQGIFSSVQYLADNKKVFEIINLGNKNPVSLLTLANTIYELLGREPQIIFEPMQGGDVSTTFANIDKAAKLLNYQPSIPFKTGIQNFIRWYEDAGQNIG